jgi:hypothetical protein
MAFERVFPTENDVGTSDTVGQVATEPNLLSLLKNLFPRQKHTEQDDTKHFTSRSFVISGLAPTDGGGLTLNLSVGSAIVDGYFVNVDAQAGHTLNDDTTNFVYLQVTRDGGNKVDGAQFVNGSADRDTTDAIIVAIVSTASGSIVTVKDERRFSNHTICGQYRGDGTINRTIDLEQTPILVMVAGVITGDSEIIGVSAPSIPGYRNETAHTKRGFYIVAQEADFTVKEELFGSKTWNTGTINNGSKVTTDVTVTGAVIGDPAIAAHTDYVTGLDHADLMQVWAVVDAANTVMVTINNNSGGDQAFSGTINVLVWDYSVTKTVHQQCLYSEVTDGSKIPYIVTGGFRVGHLTSEENLNDFGKDYQYIAWM